MHANRVPRVNTPNPNFFAHESMPLDAAAVDHIGVASRLSSHMRTLHWVTKIGSLKNSLRFYEVYATRTPD